MLKIAEFFKRIQNKQSQQLLILSIVCVCVKKHAQFDIVQEQVSFNSTTLILKGLTAMQKSQVFIKKSDIIAEINSLQTFKVITNIR